MIPVLEYMERSASKLGLNSEVAFYWATGVLSGLLDNAPTYLAFFAAALGLRGLDINDPSHISPFLSEGGRELIAISLGAAFFGATCGTTHASDRRETGSCARDGRSV